MTNPTYDHANKCPRCLKTFEEWTRKDEDMIYQRIDILEKFEISQREQLFELRNTNERIEKLDKHQDELYEMISRIQEVNMKQAESIANLESSLAPENLE